jgi:histidinol-phosphate phosphatase family protein
MRALGLGLAVITNQSGIGRGYFDEERLAAIHHRLDELLAAEGLALDGIFHCPHVPEDNCACRKPGTALVERAARTLDFYPDACFVIGDKPCDIELGQRLGAITFLVRTGYGAMHAEAGDTTPDYVVDDLHDAARIIARLLAAEQAQPHVSAARPKADSRP